MKSLKEYSLNISEQAYHDYPAWSYSIIAKYARNGFKAIATLFDKTPPTPEMEFGSLVDCIVTRGLEEAKNQYVVSDSGIPTPAPKAVLDYILTKTNVDYLQITDDVFKEAFDACAFYPNIKSLTSKIDKLAGFTEYYESRREGKKVITSKDWEDACYMADAVKRYNYLCSELFNPVDEAGIECLYQQQFVSKVKLNNTAYRVKCMVDFMKIDHNAKTIQLVDVKTSECPAYDFAQQFVRMRYDLEAQVYSYIVEQVKNTAGYEEYTILPYLFVDISRSDKIPVMYKYDQNANDGKFSFKEYVYKDWKTLLSEIIDYKTNEASVPSYIRMDEPNDIINLLNRVDNA